MEWISSARDTCLVVNGVVPRSCYSEHMSIFLMLFAFSRGAQRESRRKNEYLLVKLR
jgi:hypothetical protein